METLRSVVAGVDFSPCSADAMHQAARIAAFSRARLTAVHVVEPLQYDLTSPWLSVPLPTPTQLADDARGFWKSFAADCPGKDQIELQIRLGYRFRELMDAAAEKAADLIVLGAHGQLDSRRGIGTLASAVVRHTSRPVLVVREGTRREFKSILVAIDFSPTASRALAAAVRLAAGDGSTLTIVHVASDPWRGHGPPPAVTAAMPDFAERFHQGLHEQLRAFAAPFQHELSALHAQFHAIQQPSPGRAIATFARDHACDLAVLGTRGRTNLRDLFLGSTAERIIAEAHCSILAVPPPQQA